MRIAFQNSRTNELGLVDQEKIEQEEYEENEEGEQEEKEQQDTGFIAFEMVRPSFANLHPLHHLHEKISQTLHSNSPKF